MKNGKNLSDNEKNELKKSIPVKSYFEQVQCRQKIRQDVSYVQKEASLLAVDAVLTVATVGIGSAAVAGRLALRGASSAARAQRVKNLSFIGMDLGFYTPLMNNAVAKCQKDLNQIQIDQISNENVCQDFGTRTQHTKDLKSCILRASLASLPITAPLLGAAGRIIVKTGQARRLRTGSNTPGGAGDLAGPSASKRSAATTPPTAARSIDETAGSAKTASSKAPSKAESPPSRPQRAEKQSTSASTSASPTRPFQRRINDPEGSAKAAINSVKRNLNSNKIKRAENSFLSAIQHLKNNNKNIKTRDVISWLKKNGFSNIKRQKGGLLVTHGDYKIIIPKTGSNIQIIKNIPSTANRSVRASSVSAADSSKASSTASHSASRTASKSLAVSSTNPTKAVIAGGAAIAGLAGLAILNEPSSSPSPEGSNAQGGANSSESTASANNSNEQEGDEQGGEQVDESSTEPPSSSDPEASLSSRESSRNRNRNRRNRSPASVNNHQDCLKNKKRLSEHQKIICSYHQEIAGLDSQIQKTKFFNQQMQSHLLQQVQSQTLAPSFFQDKSFKVLTQNLNLSSSDDANRRLELLQLGSQINFHLPSIPASQLPAGMNSLVNDFNTDLRDIINQSYTGDLDANDYGVIYGRVRDIFNTFNNPAPQQTTL